MASKIKKILLLAVLLFVAFIFDVISRYANHSPKNIAISNLINQASADAWLSGVSDAGSGSIFYGSDSGTGGGGSSCGACSF